MIESEKKKKDQQNNSRRKDTQLCVYCGIVSALLAARFGHVVQRYSSRNLWTRFEWLCARTNYLVESAGSAARGSVAGRGGPVGEPPAAGRGGRPAIAVAAALSRHGNFMAEIEVLYVVMTGRVCPSTTGAVQPAIAPSKKNSCVGTVMVISTISCVYTVFRPYQP